QPTFPRGTTAFRRGQVAFRSPPITSRRLSSTTAASSFDHLVGAEQKRGWHSQPNGLCSLHIDDELELRHLINGNITCICAFEDLVDVTGSSTVNLAKIDGISYKAARFHSVTISINRRQPRLLGQLDDEPPVQIVFVPRVNNQRVYMLLGHRLEHA